MEPAPARWKMGSRRARGHSPGPTGLQRGLLEETPPDGGAPSLKAARLLALQQGSAARGPSRNSVAPGRQRSPPRRHANKLLAACCFGRATAMGWRRRGRWASMLLFCSPPPYHSISASLLNPSQRLPFRPGCVCLACHWLTDLWALWVAA